jgi:hypothetical protein
MQIRVYDRFAALAIVAGGVYELDGNGICRGKRFTVDLR